MKLSLSEIIKWAIELKHNHSSNLCRRHEQVNASVIYEFLDTGHPFHIRIVADTLINLWLTQRPAFLRSFFSTSSLFRPPTAQFFQFSKAPSHIQLSVYHLRSFIPFPIFCFPLCFSPAHHPSIHPSIHLFKPSTNGFLLVFFLFLLLILHLYSHFHFHFFLDTVFLTSWFFFLLQSLYLLLAASRCQSIYSSLPRSVLNCSCLVRFIAEPGEEEWQKTKRKMERSWWKWWTVW